MNEEIKKFVESFNSKTITDFALSELQTSRGNISFRKLIIEHNHEIWKKCTCGNEEDLRMTWACSKCGAKLFTPSKQ